MKSKYDRVHIPRGYVVQYLARGDTGYPENFLEAILNGHSLKETRGRCDFSENDEFFYRKARNVRRAYTKASRRQPVHDLHQTKAI